MLKLCFLFHASPIFLTGSLFIENRNQNERLSTGATSNFGRNYQCVSTIRKVCLFQIDTNIRTIFLICYSLLSNNHSQINRINALSIVESSMVAIKGEVENIMRCSTFEALLWSRYISRVIVQIMIYISV